jgi:hypothetical protein
MTIYIEAQYDAGRRELRMCATHAETHDRYTVRMKDIAPEEADERVAQFVSLYPDARPG